MSEREACTCGDIMQCPIHRICTYTRYFVNNFTVVLCFYYCCFCFFRFVSQFLIGFELNCVSCFTIDSSDVKLRHMTTSPIIIVIIWCAREKWLSADFALTVFFLFHIIFFKRSIICNTQYEPYKRMNENKTKRESIQK